MKFKLFMRTEAVQAALKRLKYCADIGAPSLDYKEIDFDYQIIFNAIRRLEEYQNEEQASASSGE